MQDVQPTNGRGLKRLSEEKLAQAIELIGKGFLLKDVAAAIECTPMKLWYDMQNDPNWRLAYERALEASVELEVDQMLTLADDATRDPKVVRNQLDARKWRASKRAAKRYGDRLDLTVQTVVPVAAALEAARARVRPMRDQADVIEGELVDTKGEKARGATDCNSVSGTLPAKFEDVL